VYDNYDIVMRS